MSVLFTRVPQADCQAQHSCSINIDCITKQGCDLSSLGDSKSKTGKVKLEMRIALSGREVGHSSNSCGCNGMGENKSWNA